MRAGHNRVRGMKVGLVAFREVGTGPFEPIETLWEGWSLMIFCARARAVADSPRWTRTVGKRQAAPPMMGESVKRSIWWIAAHGHGPRRGANVECPSFFVQK